MPPSIPLLIENFYKVLMYKPQLKFSYPVLQMLFHSILGVKKNEQCGIMKIGVE